MTATTQSRKRRGAATQQTAAHWFAAHGWPWAESTGAGRQGSDITGLPGLACGVLDWEEGDNDVAAAETMQ